MKTCSKCGGMVTTWGQCHDCGHRSRLRLLQLKERNDLRGEQMHEEAGRFGALADRAPAESRAVSSFNLFQTPQEIAAQMASMLNAEHTHRILEPSAGLGRLLAELPTLAPTVAIEQSPELCKHLFEQDRIGSTLTLVCRDFLSVHVGELGQFDRVIMNPPFKQGRDIKHIMHAAGMLTPGGRLVALCYDGVKQNERLKPWADEWHPLGQAFKSEGTKASVCLLVKDWPL